MGRKSTTHANCEHPKTASAYKACRRGPEALARFMAKPENKVEAICTYEGCDRPLFAADLCHGHRAQMFRGEPLRPLAGMSMLDREQRQRTCKGCGKRKSFSHFTFTKGSPMGTCRACRRNHMRDTAPERRDHKYAMEAGEWERLFDAQGRCCRICRGDDPGHRNGWMTDHDHSCCPGQGSCGACVRGILCHWCNVNLSWYERNAEAIEGYVTVPQFIPHDPE